MRFLFLLTCMVFYASAYGAAVHTIDYSKCRFVIPFSGSNVVVAAIDMRTYIRNQERKPQYVGVMRGMYGNPWNVDTQSGRPFADEVGDCLSASFLSAGFEIGASQVVYPTDDVTALSELKKTTASRKILVLIHEWKSDLVTSFSKQWTDVYYDLEMIVLDGQNKKIGTARLSGKSEVLAKGEKYKRQKLVPPEELIVQMNKLLANPKIISGFNQAATNNQSAHDRVELTNEKPTIRNFKVPENNNSSVADELAKFKKLLDDGAITKEEYNIQKKKLLKTD